MKKLILSLTVLILVSNLSFGQWQLTGNPALNNSFLGTFNQQPLRIRTQDISRMYLNRDITTSVNGQPNVDRSGFLGLGRNLGNINNWNDVLGNPSGGPLSLLHLNGYEGSIMGTGGFRNWMRSGITITANDDIMYMGPRANALDRTDAMFVWGDNAQTGSLGPDNLLFAFTAGFGDNTVPGADLDGTAPNGREIMRLTATGNVGMGPRFSNAAQPQSQLHINGENAVSTWFQLSNQTGTGMLAADGFRAGVNNVGNTYLYNQENAPMIFSTNASTVNQLARERMRLTHVGAPGVPVTAATGTTRVAVSVDPAFPLTEPRSLMHIGGRLSGQAGSTDGVRDWMNVGYLATFGTDNIYVGMKDEGQDRQDAVIAWGDNQTNLINGSGPDNLRFIFANSQFSLSPGTPDAKSDNGQEIGRFTPACATCPVNTGSLGIGNYSPSIIQNGNIVNNPNGPDSAGYIGATLDVNGDARIRTVTQKDELKQILVRDPNDLGRIYWRDGSTLTANFGAQCGNAASATLTQNTEVPLGGFNLIFSGQDAASDRVGIGTNCLPSAKLEVNRALTIPNEINKSGFSVLNSDVSAPGNYSGMGFGLRSIADGPNRNNFGGYFKSTGSYSNIGVESVCDEAAFVNGILVTNIGGKFSAFNSFTNVAVDGRAISYTDGSYVNKGGSFQGAGFANGSAYGISAIASGTDNSTVYGGYFSAVGAINGSSDVYGIYSTGMPYLGVPPNNTWAGFFDGNVNGTAFFSSSDAEIKDINGSITNATNRLNSLNVYEYHYNDFASTFMATDNQMHYGVIAQELETVFPSLVRNATFQYNPDSLGNTESKTIKTVNYTELIPILIAGFQEQNERINQLQSQLQACCTASDIRSAEYENQTGAVVPMRLHTEDAPRLGQNIPNPFDVQTRIPVYLPVSVAKAEIIFYSNEGKVIQNQLLFDRGEFSVAADAETLASGIYSYTLYVDGKPVETKRMVKR
ncbi:MAG: tail fiber domain-containing protein [Flavobacteriales bacterium]|nr:tail fiber domain-containing protein [Flavobacteriales bacterium]